MDSAAVDLEHQDDERGRQSVESSESADRRLSAVLARLGDRVAPISLARERLLSVSAPLRGLFVEEGLVRGRVVSCRGDASTSVALALVQEAMAEGSWLAVVDVATFGVDAAGELGIPLERVVRIDCGASCGDAHDIADVGAAADGCSGGDESRAANWVDVMAATIDGFDLVITRLPTDLGAAGSTSSRRLVSRLQQRGAVIVVIGDAGTFPVDVTLSSTRAEWSGLGEGEGRLRRRRVDIEASGRRQPLVRRGSLDLVGGRARVVLRTVPESDALEAESVVGDVPPAQVLREMCAELERRTNEEGVGADVANVEPGRLAAG